MLNTIISTVFMSIPMNSQTLLAKVKMNILKVGKTQEGGVELCFQKTFLSHENKQLFSGSESEKFRV